jgi:hypothetical protein
MNMSLYMSNIVLLTSPGKSVGAPGGHLVRGSNCFSWGRSPQLCILKKIILLTWMFRRWLKMAENVSRTVRENLVEEPYSFKLVTSIPGRYNSSWNVLSLITNSLAAIFEERS